MDETDPRVLENPNTGCVQAPREAVNELFRSFLNTLSQLHTHILYLKVKVRESFIPKIDSGVRQREGSSISKGCQNVLHFKRRSACFLITHQIKCSVKKPLSYLLGCSTLTVAYKRGKSQTAHNKHECVSEGPHHRPISLCVTEMPSNLIQKNIFKQFFFNFHSRVKRGR